MTFELWITYALACSIVLAIPGPTIMLVVSYALGKGRQTAWATVPGVALGDFTAMTVSLLGAGAILSASATAFSILKLVGAGYLIYLGIKMWREKPHNLEESKETRRNRPSRMFLHAYIVTALNPKGIVFFIAFVPQFMVPHQAVAPQFTILIATFVGLAMVNALLWALAAGTMRAKFRSPRAMQIMGRAGGSVLIAAGLMTALVRRATAAS